MFEEILKELWLLLDIVIAAILGFVIGFERKLRFKEASVRTHTIVCVGSALMMIISKNAFQGDFDSARVAAQIIPGIGFLGAGMIVYRKNAVSGLTTAAGVWTTAGVGMACGGQLYAIAIGATIIIIAIQCILHIDCKIFNKKKYYSVRITFWEVENSSETVKKIFEIERFGSIVASHEEGKVLIKAKLNTFIEVNSERIRNIMSQNPFICSVELADGE